MARFEGGIVIRVTGERRLRAAQDIGLKKVPVQFISEDIAVILLIVNAAIGTFRADPFFRAVLHLGQVPSEATLRQRLDSTRGWQACRLGKAIRGIGSDGGSISASPRPPATPWRRGKAVHKACRLLPSPLGAGEVCA